jgi:hypothetical protein
LQFFFQVVKAAVFFPQVFKVSLLQFSGLNHNEIAAITTTSMTFANLCYYKLTAEINQ